MLWSMDNIQKRVTDLLAKHKCELVRTYKHKVYRLPSGQIYATPKTNSDHHSWANSLSQLRVYLGLSHRGRKAKVGDSTKKKRKSISQKPKSKPIYNDTAPPQILKFSEKFRVAIQGDRPSQPVHVTQASTPMPKPPRRVTQRTERNGEVRVWSKQEIEAANIAMQCGKLDEFMRHHHQASQPEAILKQENTMLAVEQIDATIAELDAGMAAATDEQKKEQANVSRWQEEIQQAQLRLAAAAEKFNSLNQVKTDLGVIRGDIERVRPMLGLLASQPTKLTKVEGTAAKRGRAPSLRQALCELLGKADRPMRPAAIHKEMVQLPNFEHVPIRSLYTFFSQEQKKNGSAQFRRVGDLGFWPSSRPLPQGYEDYATAS